MIIMKKMNIKSIIGIALALLPFCSIAQHGVSYNQFGQLRNAFNSSLSTMDLGGSFSTLGRSQWSSVDGAPKSVWINGNIGFQQALLSVGIDAKHASLGVVKENEISAFVAKAVRLSADEYLSLSMGGGLINFRGNYNHLDPNDPAFVNNVQESNGFLSISTSYYREGKYYAGVSMPRFSLNRGKNREYEFKNVYYITAGAVFALDESFHLRPSFIISHMDDMTPRYDVSAVAFVNRKFGLGLGMQNQGDLSALMQLNFGNFGVGYSYQFSPKSPTLNQRLSTNTHEVGLRYRVGGISLL